MLAMVLLFGALAQLEVGTAGMGAVVVGAEPLDMMGSSSAVHSAPADAINFETSYHEAEDAALGGATVEDPGSALPNFDCWTDSDNTPHDVWNDLYDFGKTLELLLLEQAVEPTDIAILRKAGAKHLGNLLGYASSEGEMRLARDCPYGLAALRFAQWYACRLVSAPPLLGSDDAKENTPEVCAGLHVGLSTILAPPATLPTVLNSRWMRPICGLAEFVRPALRGPTELGQDDPLAVARHFYDCTFFHEGNKPSSGMDWQAFLRSLTGGSSDGGFTTDWIMKSLRFAFAPGRLIDAELKMNECPLGFITIVVEKLHLAQVARTEEYGKLAAGFVHLVLDFEQRLSQGAQHNTAISDGLAALMDTSWPVLPLLCSMARNAQADTPSGRHGYQYKPYSLDFRPLEILRPRLERNQLTVVRELPREEHIERLRVAAHSDEVSEAYGGVLGALFTVLESWEQGAPGTAGTKLALVTMLWGSRLAGYLPGSLRRAEAFGLHARYLIFCLDEVVLLACRGAHPLPALCVPGRLQTIYNKYTVLAAIVQLGFDALYLDFDTLLLADPVPKITEASETAEVLVSRDFGSECLNTGVIYLKSHPDTAELLVALLVWLWHHPYEFSQKAFSAFLRHENATDVRFHPLPIQIVPRWAVLEPTNAFVTSAVYDLGVEGWTGELEGIAIFHFLDGTGGVDPDRAIEGKYLNLYDLFYDNPLVDLNDITQPLWRQDPRIERALLRSRLPAPPSKLLRCMLMDSGEA